MPRQVVLALGNLLNHDEGLGLEALKLLSARLGPQGELEFVDGGVLGLDLLPLVESCSHLLVLDAADAGLPPGALIELSRDQIPLYTGVKLSEHQLTFQEVLALANLRGRLPAHVHLIGAQPSDISIGIGLSPVVQSTLPLIAGRAEAILRDWHLL